MHLVAKLDDIGKPAWIALMIVSFMIWWPIGLAALAFLIGSGRMGCGCHGNTVGASAASGGARCAMSGGQ